MSRLLVIAWVAAAAILAACAPGATGTPTSSVSGVAVAGPTCPVVTDPPQSGCQDRPVAGAELVIVDGGGDQVARVTTSESGTFTISLPAGHYRLRPQPVEGLMGTAPEQAFTVAATGNQPRLTVTYDTGIR